MARANLVVDESVKSAWAAALGETGEPYTYVLVLTVDGAEIKALHVHKGSSEHTVQQTFAKISEESNDSASARLFLVKQHAADPISKWTLISYVPDGVHPKTKMLLAAARDDLKRSLDAARFTADYHVTEKSELSYDVYTEWRQRDRESAMSEWEKAKERVVAESNAVRLASGGKMAGMAAVPFKVEAAVTDAAKKTLPAAPAAPAAAAAAAAEPAPAAESSPEEAAAEGAAEAAPEPAASPAASPAAAPEFDFVEIAVSGETVLLGAAGAALVGDSVAAHKAAIAAAVATEAPKPAGGAGSASTPRSPAVGAGPRLEPRYFLVRLGYSALPAALPALLYYCPEGTLPRLRMTYSTAKAALTDALAAAGVALAAQPEARDEEELASALASLHAAPSASPSASSASASGGAGAHAGVGARFGGGGFGSPGMGMRLPGMGGSPFSPGSASASASHEGGDDAAAAGGAHKHTPSKPGFGGVALPGMGAIGLPGMGGLRGSPAMPGHGHALSPASSSSGGGEDGGFDKPARPGKGPARVMGVGLPGMSPPGAK